MKAIQLSHRYFVFVLIVIMSAEFVFLLFSGWVMMRFAHIETKQPEQIGVTFSQVQAERYGTNWRANYTALLNDLHVKHIRIVAYWDRVELSRGQYNFSELDYMVSQAKAHQAHITLALGQRVLRYPECYYPSWLNKNDPLAVRAAIDPYITALAKHFVGNTTVTDYQLENEFLLHAFGECPNQNLTRGNLAREIKVLRAADATHPIIITASDEFGLPLSGPLADGYGFSMYKTVWNQVTKRGYFTYPQPGLYNWWRASLISLFWGQTIRVHELQAEPWGPVGNELLPQSEAAKSMSPQKLRANLNYARATHIRQIDLWGAEWWYWEKVNKHNDAMWQAVKSELH